MRRCEEDAVEPSIPETSPYVPPISASVREPEESQPSATPPQQHDAPLSKNQQRRLRREADRETFLEQRRLKRVEKRRREQEKRRMARESGLEVPAARVRPRRNRNRNQSDQPGESEPVGGAGVTMVVDMGFENKMMDGECKSMAKQLAHCYACHRRAKLDKPVQFIVSDFDADSCPRTEAALARLTYQNWTGMRFQKKSFMELERDDGGDDGRDKIVYLTADSPNVLTELREDEVYVLGGIVDRNRYKNLCLDKAIENGVRHAQLPISQYIDLKSRRILTVNQVFQIMMAYLECRDWQQAFVSIIPPRKF